MDGGQLVQRSRFGSRICVSCMIAGFSCLLFGEVAGQLPGSFAGEVSTVDASGNAVPIYPFSRVGSLPQKAPQPRRVFRLPTKSAAPTRGGILSGLARPSDVYRMMQRRRLQRPRGTAYVSPLIRQNYARYGGFYTRASGGQPGDMQTVLQRRQALVQATMLTAPVQRARILHGLGDMGLPTAVSEAGIAQPQTPDQLAGLDSLGEWLQVDAAISHDRTRGEAWAFFRKGNEDSGYFHRAARAFEAAVTLDPMDFESRIGELFSHLSLGAYVRSVVLLANLARRDQALFSHTLDFRELYAERIHARQVCMQCEAYAQANAGDAGAMALHAFVLWYGGERDRAIIAADALAGTAGGRHFADWGSQMREAKRAPGGTGELP